jgi:hypothetical protein
MWNSEKQRIYMRGGKVVRIADRRLREHWMKDFEILGVGLLSSREHVLECGSREKWHSAWPTQIDLGNLQRGDSDLAWTRVDLGSRQRGDFDLAWAKLLTWLMQVQIDRESGDSDLAQTHIDLRNHQRGDSLT